MDQTTHRLMMSMLTGVGTLKTQNLNYTASSWTAPSTTAVLLSLEGKGSDGGPAEDYIVWRYETRTVRTYTVAHNGEKFVVDGGTTSNYGIKPDNSCTFRTLPSDPTFSAVEICLYHTDTSYWDSDPAYNGSPTTGFGKTFPGGAQGPATPQTFTSVAVTPGQSYPLSIPYGGYIKISYYE